MQKVIDAIGVTLFMVGIGGIAGAPEVINTFPALITSLGVMAAGVFILYCRQQAEKNRDGILRDLNRMTRSEEEAISRLLKKR